MSAESVSLGRRQRRKAEARERLMSAAREVIADTGLRSMRISDITARADLGFGTFYTYFDTKDALVEAVVDEVLKTLAAAIGSAAQEESDPAEGAATSYRRFLRFGQDEPELASVLVALDGAEGRFDAAIQPWARNILLRGNESGRFAIPDIELCLTALEASAVSAIRAILSGRIEPGTQTESAGAEMMLRSFGLDAEEAHQIAHREISAALD
ncbi:TetR/AcrR family transcriptional regulator [Mycobacteroides abscessus]|nr:TetR/AcrR family transcriptional regulator [Mycobacteroides abscessus]MDM2645629.1 TetR/AcrR family transcriptional regulator [Mycobacteroides abscessus]MDM2656050.1 TetR/AcrR family transcriptional regulator [Mycobacteroides abscessus]MDM2664237.1 TetR/AcrR family transcriptional regulator [Mycobacteroides abscessus]MDM2668645.1 TetR/AcrR family transcriptional regulator [Mycobacteroides abscessus]MDM2672457.1 TetR/AcrR family transcriptional regulator [Mycobacteroides abscessus]